MLCVQSMQLTCAVVVALAACLVSVRVASQSMLTVWWSGHVSQAFAPTSDAVYGIDISLMQCESGVSQDAWNCLKNNLGDNAFGALRVACCCRRP